MLPTTSGSAVRSKAAAMAWMSREGLDDEHQARLADLDREIVKERPQRSSPVLSASVTRARHDVTTGPVLAGLDEAESATSRLIVAEWARKPGHEGPPPVPVECGSAAAKQIAYLALAGAASSLPSRRRPPIVPCNHRTPLIAVGVDRMTKTAIAASTRYHDKQGNG